MKQIRCEAIIVQIIGTEYDNQNRPIGEHTLPPLKVFRATARDFWPQVDAAVNEATKAATTPPAPPAEKPVAKIVAKKGKRR